MKDRIEPDDYPQPHLIKGNAIWYVREEDHQLMQAPLCGDTQGDFYRPSELLEVHPGPYHATAEVETLTAVLLPVDGPPPVLGPVGWSVMPVVSADSVNNPWRADVPVFVQYRRVFDLRTSAIISEEGEAEIWGWGALNGPGIIVRCGRWSGLISQRRWMALIEGTATIRSGPPHW